MDEFPGMNVVLYRLTSNIQSEDRRKRKEALNELYSTFFKHGFCESSVLQEVLGKIQKDLFKCLYDVSEAVRDSSINVLSEIILNLKLNEEFLRELVPILLWRLGENEVNEPSEEIRLRLVTVIDDIISKAKETVAPFTSDLIQILLRTLVDNYPKVRQQSCKCAANLASTVPRHFYDHSNKLVKPILASFNHQHFRMRIAAIEALGKVVKYGNTKNLQSQEVFGSLAQRLFDSNPTVRSAVAKVIGDWLLNLHDRYSFFTKMIPLILTCLSDELPEIRDEAWQLWCKAGIQYEQENEQDLKDKIDFMSEKPEHYPSNVIRPNLGCRTLVQRNTCQILPALSKELEDWKNDIRIKSAQLLCWIVLHAETDITQHVETLLSTMYTACNQSDSRIVENVEKAAEYIAYFVSPDTYMKLVLEVVEDSCTPGHLCILAALLRGTQHELLYSHVSSITALLSCDNICRNRNDLYQFQLLKCCESLIDLETEKISENANKFFIIIVTVKALSSKPEISDFALDLLFRISKKCGNNNVTEIYENYAKILLDKMFGTVETWSSTSYDYQIFQVILEEGGSALGKHLIDIIELLIKALRPEGDAIVKSKFFTSLSIILCQKDFSSPIDQLAYHRFTKLLIQDCICPNLVWRAGRAAEALRAVVLACLCAAILPQKELRLLFTDARHGETSEKFSYLETCSEDMVEDVFTSLFPLLINTIEDSLGKSRLFSLKLLQHLFIIARKGQLLNPDHVNQIYPMLLKRLDDVSDEVRKESVNTLDILYKNLPVSYNPQGYQPHLESLFSTIFIHLDDPDPQFQERIMDMLKTIGRITPQLLYDRLNAVKDRFRNFKMCTEVLNYTQECLK